MKNTPRMVGMVVAASLASWGHASAQQESLPTADTSLTTKWQAAIGLDYSAGRYGATVDTTVINVPLNLVMQADRLRLEFSIPYLNVEGPGLFAGGVVIPGSSSSVTNRSGLGDVNLGAAWLVHHDADDFPAVEFAGTVKLPTAEVGLGTGRWDYNILANIYHTFSPQFMLFGSVGYQWLSDFKTFKLEDGVTGTIGANFKPSTDTSLGVTAAYRQEYFSGLGDQFSLTPYILWNFTDDFRITAYGLAGLSKSSPRIGGGFRLVLLR